MHLEASHESFIEGTVLGKDSENMAVKGNSDTISEWVSSMTIDHRKGLEHTGKIAVLGWKEQPGKVHQVSLGISPPVLWGTWPKKGPSFLHRVILAPRSYFLHDQRQKDWLERQLIQQNWGLAIDFWNREQLRSRRKWFSLSAASEEWCDGIEAFG